MEAIEIAVYTFVAVIVGGIIIAFLVNIHPTEFYYPIKNFFLHDKDISYDKVTTEEFPLASYNLWKACGFGKKNMSRIVYVDDTIPINKSTFFTPIIKFNFCYTIQSENMSCGTREDLVIIGDEIIPPSLIKIFCNSTTKKLEIHKIA